MPRINEVSHSYKELSNYSDVKIDGKISKDPQLFFQVELNDLRGDLNHLIDAAKLLGSRHSEGAKKIFLAL